MASVLVLELFTGTPLYHPDLYGIVALTLLATVTVSAFRGGVRAGVLSAAIAVLYNSYLLSAPGQPFHYAASDLRRALIIGIALPPLAIAVGHLRERVDQLLYRERELRRKAEELTDALQSHAIHLEEQTAQLEAVNDELSRAAAEARLNLTRLEGVLRVLPVGVFISDLAGQVQMTNPAATAIWGGRTPLVGIEQYREYRAWRAGTGEKMEPEDWPLTRAIRTGETILDEELEIEAFDGARRAILASAVLFHDDAGEVLGGIAVNVDITERKKLEEQLRQAQKMEAVGQLAGGIAHDFNNLLTGISGYAHMALESVDGEARTHVEEIVRAAHRAASLTRQLLSFSRRQVLQPKRVQVNQVVSRVQSLLSRLIPADITAVSSLTAAENWVEVDPAQIEQVVLNLMINARDAMPGGGTIVLETEVAEMTGAEAQKVGLQPGNYVHLRVVDTGSGMPPEVRARAFEPFFTTKPAGSGTGLGLATVHGIVEQSGGAVWVESEAGQGSTFTVALPLVAAPTEADERTDETSYVERSGPATILLVEDEPSVRTLARRILERSGHTVLVAENGREALRLTEEHCGPIHLVLTDVVMPEMSGKELVARLVSLRPGVPVLFMSGYAEDEIARRGVIETGVAFIGKPFAPSDLSRKVAELLADSVYSPP